MITIAIMIEIVIAMTAGTMVETAMFVVTGTGIAAIGIGIATGTSAVTVIGTGAIVEAAAGDALVRQSRRASSRIWS
jgi:hypothetical protein